MNKLIYIMFFVVLASCSAEYHALKGEKHIKKAIYKDPSIEQFHYDTLTVSRFVYDTIRNNDGTITIQKTLVHYDTIIKTVKYDFSDMKRWFQIWQEELTERTQIRQGERTERNETDERNKTERNKDTQENKTERTEARNDFWSKIGKWGTGILSLLVVLTVVILYLKKRNILNFDKWKSKYKG